LQLDGRPIISGSLRAKPGCGCPAWQRRN